jgi:hypothetical protein
MVLRIFGFLCLLLPLALFAQDRSNNPFSKDYKGGGGPKSSSTPGGSPAPALTKKGPASESRNKPANAKAVAAAAVQWLANAQKPDGHWESQLGGETGDLVTSSFCALALMASGKGARAQVDKAAQFVMANIFKKGHNPDPKWDQTNWQIAVGGMFLAEYYAETKSADVKAVLEQVVQEIFARIEPSGGWGHYHGGKNPLNYIELEIVSNWMLSAAGMCQRLGLRVPGDRVGLAVKFIEECCSPGQGNVGYSPNAGQKGVGCPGRTGGALFAFSLLKQHGHPIFSKMGDYWKADIDKSSEGHGSLCMGFLGSALGARTIGADAWDTYVAKFFPQILSAATGDGSFKHLTGKTPISMGSDNMAGPAYNTAVYALILQLDLGNLTFVGQKN